MGCDWYNIHAGIVEGIFVEGRFEDFKNLQGIKYIYNEDFDRLMDNLEDIQYQMEELEKTSKEEYENVRNIYYCGRRDYDEKKKRIKRRKRRNIK